MYSHSHKGILEKNVKLNLNTFKIENWPNGPKTFKKSAKWALFSFFLHPVQYKLIFHWELLLPVRHGCLHRIVRGINWQMSPAPYLYLFLSKELNNSQGFFYVASEGNAKNVPGSTFQRWQPYGTTSSFDLSQSKYSKEEGIIILFILSNSNFPALLHWSSLGSNLLGNLSSVLFIV